MATLPPEQESSIIPLSQIKTAMVLSEVPAPDLEEVAERFFGKWGISWELIPLRNSDVSWWGKPSQKIMDKVSQSNPDLFISLTAGTHFPGTVLARLSSARFKMGRQRINGKVFDMIVSDPPDRNISAAESFKAMATCLEKIL